MFNIVDQLYEENSNKTVPKLEQNCTETKYIVDNNWHYQM